MTDIEPLPYRLIEVIPPDSEFDRRLDWIPFVGWLIARDRWIRKSRPVWDHYCHMLKERPDLPVHRWGHSKYQQYVGQLICRVLSKEIGWPNDRFLPADPISVFLWDFADCLTYVEALMTLEDEFEVKLLDVVEANYLNWSLGELHRHVIDLQAIGYSTQRPIHPLR